MNAEFDKLLPALAQGGVEFILVGQNETCGRQAQRPGVFGRTASLVGGTEIMNTINRCLLSCLFGALAMPPYATAADKSIGVGSKPISGAEIIIDGARKTLDEKWTYWEGPGFKSSLPIKWKIV